MSMENMFAPKQEVAQHQNTDGNEKVPSPELVKQSESVVAQATEITKQFDSMPEGAKKSKVGLILGGVVSAIASGTLGAYKLSDSFSSALNGKIESMQHAMSNLSSEEMNQVTNAGIGALAVGTIATIFLIVKRSYEKSQQNNLAA